jgi:hypothetical protein
VPIALAMLAVCAPVPAMAASSDFHVTPSNLYIRESFQGAPVTISADIPKKSGTVSAIVEIRGTEHDDHLLRQGRRGGLWMSVGEVTIHGAPSAYLVMSTPDLPSHSDIGDGWGYGALQKHVEFTGVLPKDGADTLFDQFVKLKESEGLYGIFPKSLNLGDAPGDSSKVEGRLMLPSNIAPGNYHIVLSVLNSGKLMEQRATDLHVEMQGIPGFLTKLAYQHSVLYGLAAVVIAIITGFVMGILFTSKGAH